MSDRGQRGVREYEVRWRERLNTIEEEDIK